jgi:hypothetical protein
MTSSTSSSTSMTSLSGLDRRLFRDSGRVESDEEEVVALKARDRISDLEIVNQLVTTQTPYNKTVSVKVRRDEPNVPAFPIAINCFL